MDDRIIEFEEEYRDKRSGESIGEYYFDLRQDISLGTERNIRTSLNYLYEFLEKRDIEFSEMDQELASDFIDYIREAEDIKRESTVKHRVGLIAAMVNWFNANGLISGNPFDMARKAEDFNTEGSPRANVPIDELRTAVADIQSPTQLAIVVTMLKTGVRVAEVVNFDERDINLNHPISEYLADPRTELLDSSDSLLVDSTVEEGDKINGEIRRRSNKPNSTRKVPLDKELKEVLVWYLAQRVPPFSEAKPLFVSNYQAGNRFDVKGLQRLFNSWSDEHGWYDPDHPGSVKPHWCRHWFTTNVRSNLDPEMIKIGNEDDFLEYLRGDTATDTKSEYIQMTWGDRSWMHEALDDALPRLLTKTPPHYREVEFSDILQS